MDWESLKFFLALAETGTLAGAGRALGVRHSTVLRRVALLEEGLGLSLVERHPRGYELTAAGRDLAETARPVRDRLVEAERRLSGQDLRLAGTVRLAAPDGLLPHVAQAVAAVRAHHPGILVEVSVSTAMVSLHRHEADIALRVTGTPPDTLVGRRLADVAHAIYAAAPAPAAVPDGAWARHDWIGYTADRAALAQARWLAANVPAGRVVMRTHSTRLMLLAAAAGVGLAVLPCYQADAAAGLARVGEVGDLGQGLWLLTHEDLRDTPRVRAVMDILAGHLAARWPRPGVPDGA